MQDNMFDVIVLGSGAAGLTAALVAAHAGRRVLVLEKSDLVGGTSAWSGGMVWVPNNPVMSAAGIDDSLELATEYLMSLSHDLIDSDLARAMLEAGPEMVDWLAAHTPVRFRMVRHFPDYHPEHPGACRTGGRSLETDMFPFDELGDWADRVTVGAQLPAHIAMSETALGRGAPSGVPARELERRQIRDERGCGQGLIGRLLRGCLDVGVTIVTRHRATALQTEDGRVIGVHVDTAGGLRTFRATGGVILATGGFDWDRDLVRAFVRGPLERTAAVPTNTGDGLKMAMRVGAALGTMREAWWVPMIDVVTDDGRTTSWQVNGERSRPRTIMVNKRGERFTNEAANYNALGSAFHVVDVATFDYPNHPAWMVFDHGYLEKFPMAGHSAARPTPSWMVEAQTLPELADLIGVPADALTATVARWNNHARAGRDPDFGRGDSVHDRYWGDPEVGDVPAATMGPIDRAPFYAVTVRSGALGTKGGPRTDTHGRVLEVDGRPIDGLYAAGNAMASVMGMTYGGAGGTLGPAMIFGYLAGRHAAERACSAPDESGVQA